MFIEEVITVLTLIVALNVWLLLGGLIIYFLDSDHIRDNNIIALLGMYFMFPVVIVLSVIEGKSNGRNKPDDSNA